MIGIEITEIFLQLPIGADGQVHIHDEAGQAGTVRKDVPKVKFPGIGLVEAADDMSVQDVADLKRTD